MPKLKWKSQLTVGALIDHLTKIADVHGRDIPVITEGHFGEALQMDVGDFSKRLESRGYPYETPENRSWRDENRRSIEVCVAVHTPDIGPDPD